MAILDFVRADLGLKGADRIGFGTPALAGRGRSRDGAAHIIPHEQLSGLVPHVDRLDVERDRVLFDEGAPLRHIFVVIEGAVKTYKLLPDGRCQITGFLFPGDLMGLPNYDGTHVYGAETTTRSLLYRVPRKEFSAALARSPALSKWALGAANHELAAAQEQMLLLGRKTALERVASFLLMMAHRFGASQGASMSFRLPMTRSDVADSLGLTGETVSRAISRLRRDGVVETLGASEIIIRRIDQLRLLAG